MENKPRPVKLEELIVRDPKLFFTMTSFAMVLAIYINLSVNASPVIGTTATIVYFLINAAFLGQAFFKAESPFLRFAIGSLLLIVLLGLIAWAVMILCNLDTIRSAIALSIVTALCSFSNKKVKHENAD